MGRLYGLRRKESLFIRCLLPKILGGCHTGYLSEVSQCGGLATEANIEEYLLEVTARCSINNLDKLRHTLAINIVGVVIMTMLLNSF